MIINKKIIELIKESEKESNNKESEIPIINNYEVLAT